MRSLVNVGDHFDGCFEVRAKTANVPNSNNLVR